MVYLKKVNLKWLSKNHSIYSPAFAYLMQSTLLSKHLKQYISELWARNHANVWHNSEYANNDEYQRTNTFADRSYPLDIPFLLIWKVDCSKIICVPNTFTNVDIIIYIKYTHDTLYSHLFYVTAKDDQNEKNEKNCANCWLRLNYKSAKLTNE